MRGLSGIAVVCAMAMGAWANETIRSDLTLTEDRTVEGTLIVTEGVTVNLAGHQLTVNGLSGSGTITSVPMCALNTGVAAPGIIAEGAILWLDASARDTLTVDGDGKVTKWASRVGGNAAQYLISRMSYPAYDSERYGIPTVDFGEVGSQKDLAIDIIQTAKTVFWVTRIAQTQSAFWLGHGNGYTYNFHRGENGEYCSAANANIARMWNGLDEVRMSTDSPDPETFHVIVAQMKSPSTFNSLTNDRGLGDRNGGKQLSELICFDRDLTDAERIAVTRYLADKWNIRCGELHIDVAEDASTENGTVALTGYMRVVKEGKGAFVASMANQSYTGGTEINGGIVTLGTGIHPLGPGNATQTVTVNTDATLDINNKAATDTCVYNYLLAGTVNITGGGNNWAYDVNQKRQVFGNSITLLGDAHLTGCRFLLGNFSNTLTINMEGHTLYMDLTTGDGYTYARNVTTVGPGEIVCRAGFTEVNVGFNLISSGLWVTDGSYSHLGDVGYATGSFRYDAAKWMTHRTASPVHVYGRYLAGWMRPWITLQSGATLDLSNVSGTFELQGVDPVSGGPNREFSQPGTISLLSANAAYTVDVGARDVTVGERLVAFPPAYDPAESVTFAFAATGAQTTPEEREIALKVKTGTDGGIYVKSTAIPYARWVINGDDAGWKFYNVKDGTENTDWNAGVTGEVEVRIFSYDEYEAVKQQSVSPAAFVIAGRVKVPDEVAALEMTTCYDRFMEGGIIDLNGKRVTLKQFKGVGEITDSTTDTAHPGELHLSAAEHAAEENVFVAITGNVKLIKEGEGTLTVSRGGQSYTGGTEVRGGSLILGTATHPLGPGDGTQMVTVNEGCLLDINNKISTSTCLYTFELGGTVRVQGESDGWGWNSSRCAFAGIVLVGDAHITGSRFWFGAASGMMPLVMNGYTLHMDLNNYLYARNIKTEGDGKILFPSGWCEFNNNLNLRTADVAFGADTPYAHLGDAGFTVGGFTYDCAKWMTHRTAEQVIVHGRYVAGAMRPWLTLMDGATLDLSKVTGSWDASGVAPVTGGPNRSFTAAGLVSFDSGAEIAVELGDRGDVIPLSRSDFPYLVTWAEQPEATFVLDETMYRSGFRIFADETGLRLIYAGGTVILVQ
ncbi:MAG: hypothetical protein J6334_11930 [Kiritimatiellae bacterium]|nr:hypothetical protein [Kiritimatiellia bacterium]